MQTNAGPGYATTSGREICAFSNLRSHRALPAFHASA